MSRASRARRIAAAAAYGGGGLGALGALGGAAFLGVLFGESKLARRRIPQATGGAPVSDDTVWAAAGVSPTRPPIRMAMIGDSLAAGYGVHRERDTPGAHLAIGISTAARRPVHMTSVAVVGAETRGLGAQLDALGSRPVELAVLIVGANDITHRIGPDESVRNLETAVTRLATTGVQVVVGTCPDLGTIRPIAQPLRWVVRRRSRNLAAAQTIAVVRAGGRTVSLGDLLGPLFTAQPDLFADDRFHPSAAGYRAAAQAILPSALDALGLRTRARSASPFTTRLAKPLAKAAAQAAARPGSEVAPSEPATKHPLRHGPWARVRRRRPGPTVVAEQAVTLPVQPQPDGGGSGTIESSRPL